VIDSGSQQDAAAGMVSHPPRRESWSPVLSVEGHHRIDNQSGHIRARLGPTLSLATMELQAVSLSHSYSQVIEPTNEASIHYRSGQTAESPLFSETSSDLETWPTQQHE